MTFEAVSILTRLEQTHCASREELARLLAPGEHEAALLAAADRVRQAAVGDEVHLRALIEFSNRCWRNCLYCGLRRGHRELARYRMSPDEILEAVAVAAGLRYRTIVLQSGEDPYYAAPLLAYLLREIKARHGVAITLSIGERSEEEYRLLKEAGADRFLLRIETSSPELYQRLHPDAVWQARTPGGTGTVVLARCGWQGSKSRRGVPPRWHRLPVCLRQTRSDERPRPPVPNGGTGATGWKPVPRSAATSLQGNAFPNSTEMHSQSPFEGWSSRLECLHALRRLGYQVGSGVMIGLPGQDLRMLADDLLFLQSLDLDMIGAGPFIPHPATPLAEEAGGTLELSLRFIACLRLLCPEALIPATTALGALDPAGRQRALQAGANVLMPNCTPLQYRKQYQLYPGKICTGEDALQCRRCVEAMITGLGRTVARGYGHSLRCARLPAPSGRATG